MVICQIDDDLIALQIRRATPQEEPPMHLFLTRFRQLKPLILDLGPVPFQRRPTRIRQFYCHGTCPVLKTQKSVPPSQPSGTGRRGSGGEVRSCGPLTDDV